MAGTAVQRGAERCAGGCAGRGSVARAGQACACGMLCTATRHLASQDGRRRCWCKLVDAPTVRMEARERTVNARRSDSQHAHLVGLRAGGAPAYPRCVCACVCGCKSDVAAGATSGAVAGVRWEEGLSTRRPTEQVLNTIDRMPKRNQYICSNPSCDVPVGRKRKGG